MPLTVSNTCIKCIYVTETELIDRFVGAQLWLWNGNGSDGQLGNQTSIGNRSPIQTISGGVNWSSVSAGEDFAGGIKTDGTLWLWGRNLCGELGNGNNSSASSPVQTISGGTDWFRLSTGDFTSAAIKKNGTLWMWGRGHAGQLGNGTTIARSSPVQIGTNANWKQVDTDWGHTVAIKTDGTLWTWGRGSNGRLGQNLGTYRSSPVQTVAGGNNWSCGEVGGLHTGGLKSDGTLWMWGYNRTGQVGDNTTISRSSPVQISGTNWKKLSLGCCHSAAIKTDGTLWLWGSNSFGQIGNNNGQIDTSSPVQTSTGGTNWKMVSAGRLNTSAIKLDGRLWNWGAGSALGCCSLAARIFCPIQTLGCSENWLITSSYEGTVAIRSSTGS